jgi:hypothetical protein
MIITTPGKLPLPTIEQDDSTGEVILKGFCIDRSTGETVNIRFREPTAADDRWIKKLADEQTDSSDMNLNMMILVKLCIQFGEDDSVTIGELQTDKIPYTHYRMLKVKVFDAIFPDL